MTGKSRAIAGLVAILGLAMWGIALTLAGDDVPLVPPSVELGGPPVTVAPALPSGGAESVDDDLAGADRAVEPGAEPREETQVADVADEEPETSSSSTQGGREAHVERSGRTGVVTPLPVRVEGDSATPTPPTVAPASPTVRDPAPPPSPSTTAPAPAPTASPSPSPSPEPASPVQDPDPGTEAFHVAGTDCQVPDAPGLARAAERTAGTPASPPPQGCPGGPARGSDAPPQDADQHGRDGGDLKAVREQDDDDHGHEDGGRGGGGRGRHGAGGG